MRFIPLDSLVAKIERIKNTEYNKNSISDDIACCALDMVIDAIDTLEVKEVGLELITGWFDHIAQMADDRKTLNGEVMEDWAALDEIKCLAKNSSEFITKHYKAQEGE